MTQSNHAAGSDGARGLVVTGGLLAGLVIHNLIYPLTKLGGLGPVVFYVFYALLFVIPAHFLTQSKWLKIAISAAGTAVLVAGLANAYSPSQATGPAIFGSSILYHLLMVVVLVRYTFGSRAVMTDVVLAATSLYIVIGSAFAALFALIEWLQPGSFTTASGLAMDWQLLLYYSYVTLTTVGYGDITPTGYYAQAFAAFEAMIGVLYTVILLSRLVGLHTARPK